MSDLEKWILGLAAAAYAALAGALWKHINSDVEHRERTAKLEQKADEHARQLCEQDKEIHDIRRRWHEFRDGTMKDAWELFSEWKQEIIAMFRRDRE